MMPEETRDDTQHEPQANDSGLPAIENGFELPPPADESVIADDDPQLLASATKLIENDAEQDVPVSEATGRAAPVVDETSDAAAVPSASQATPEIMAKQPPVNWDRERSAHKLIVELKRVESQIRELLGERDPKTKRKLAGTRRWRELEEDILSWRFSDQFDETTLRHINELIARRHYLFNRLRFVAATRPTLNS